MQVLPAVTAPFKNAKKSILAKHAALRKEQERRERHAQQADGPLNHYMPMNLSIDTPPNYPEWPKGALSAVSPMTSVNGRSPVSPSSSPPTPLQHPMAGKLHKKISSLSKDHPKVSSGGIVKAGRPPNEAKGMRHMLTATKYERVCHFSSSDNSRHGSNNGGSSPEEINTGSSDDGSSNGKGRAEDQHIDLGWLMPLTVSGGQQHGSQQQQQRQQHQAAMLRGRNGSGNGVYPRSSHEMPYTMQQHQQYVDARTGKDMSDYCFADNAPHQRARQAVHFQAQAEIQLLAYKRAHGDWSSSSGSAQQHAHHPHMSAPSQGYHHRQHQSAQMFQLLSMGSKNSGNEVVGIIGNSMDFLGGGSEDGGGGVPQQPGGCEGKAEQQSTVWWEFMS